MYRLFEQTLRLNTAHRDVSQIDLARRRIWEGLGIVQRYCRSRVTAVLNQHVLCRTLNTFALPPVIDPIEMLDMALSRSPYIERQPIFTSSLSIGEPTRGQFTHPHNREYLIAYDTAFMPEEAKRNWMELRSVVFLEHPFSDLSMVVPGPNVQRTVEGDVFIGIDVSMLLFQFRCWQNHVQENGYIHGNIQQFVSMYVLPNMLNSYFDLAIVNRFMALANGEPFSVCSTKTPYIGYNYDRYFDKDLEAVLKSCEGNRTYEALLADIPAVTAKNGLEALQIPAMPTTRQVWWALLASRLRIMETLVQLPKRTVRANRSLNNELLLIIKEIRSGGTFNMLPEAETQNYLYRFNRLQQIIKET